MMPSFGVALVLFEEFLGAGEGHLVDVLVHFLGGHADAVVRKAELPGLGVHGDGHAEVFPLRPAGGQLVLGHGVAAVGHHLTDKNILIGIQPALDDRHDVLSVNGNAAVFLHDVPP